jgi:hypothetical protein
MSATGPSCRKQAEFVEVTDVAEVAADGSMSMPGLVVDEKVLSARKVLTAAAIGGLL